MHRYEIWILYRRELRAALRERAIVVNSILLPIFLYPLLLWMVFTGITYVQGASERAVSRVALMGLGAAQTELRDSLAALESVSLDTIAASRDAAVERVREGELDALVEVLPPGPEGAALAGNFRVRITYDRSVSRSRRARDRVEDVVDAYRERWLAQQAETLGIAPAALEQFRVEEENTASGGDMGAFLLGEMVPLFLVIWWRSAASSPPSTRPPVSGSARPGRPS
ncbi:MAG TPA: hypothetical protein VF188_04990 [Longimicrobiales bacterium]